MIESYVGNMTREGLFLVLLASGLPVMVSLIVGLVISLFQATTQIQEQTLSFVPKMIAVFAVLAATGPWMGSTLLRYTQRCLGGFVDVVH